MSFHYFYSSPVVRTQVRVRGSPRLVLRVVLATVLFLVSDHLLKTISFDINKEISVKTLTSTINVQDFVGMKNNGIFLDLSCEKGLQLLYLCSNANLFGIRYSWLVWSDSNSTHEIFDDVNLFADSDVTVVEPSYRSFEDQVVHVRDIYKIHSSTHLISNEIARWTTNSRLVVIKDKPSRDNFHQFKMNANHVIVDVNATIEKLEDRFYKPNSAAIARFTISWFLDLARVHNFSYNYTFEKWWGITDSTGNWSGMMGTVQRGEVEVVFSVTHMRVDRLPIGTFVASYLTTRLVFVFIQPAVFGSPLAIVKPFSPGNWICIILLMVIIAFIAKFFSRYDSSQDIDSWSAIIEFTVGGISQQGPNENMTLVSSRMMAFTFFILSLFVMVYYNAAILNSLLSPSPKEINSYDKLMESKLKLGFSDLPYMRDFTDQGVFGPMNTDRRKLFNKIGKQDRTFYSLQEGLDKIKVDKFALLSDTMLVYPAMIRSFDESQICNMDVLYNLSPKVNIGLMTRKKSPYHENFARKFFWFEEVGLKMRINKLWVESRPPCIANREAISIGLVALSLGFYILLIGSAASVLLLIVEIILKK